MFRKNTFVATNRVGAGGMIITRLSLVVLALTDATSNEGLGPAGVCANNEIAIANIPAPVTNPFSPISESIL